jgi:hypothetical protein
MTRTRLAVLTFGLALAATTAARGDDAAEARALLDKAVKAHGGVENVAKYKGSATAFKGTFHGMGLKIPMSGTVTTFGPDRVKADIEVEAGGQTFRVVNVLGGDKGWLKIGNDTKDMGKAELTVAREQQHTGWVATLAPLVTPKGYTLSPAGELLVDDRPTLGVKVAAKGRRDVTLYFDKTTWLLARHDSTVTDEGSGREVAQEVTMTDYRAVQGTKQAWKFVIRRDAKLFMEGEVTGVTLTETLDASQFGRP